MFARGFWPGPQIPPSADELAAALWGDTASYGPSQKGGQLATILNKTSDNNQEANTIAALTVQGLTQARIAKIDFLTAPVATAAAVAAVQTTVNTILVTVQNLNNLSALATLIAPSVMEVPSSGSIAYPIVLVVKDSEGHSINLTANPTLTAVNAAGTDRSGNLSSVSHPAIGQYTFTYTVPSNAAEEGIRIGASGTTVAPDSTNRIAYAVAAVVSVDTAAAIAAIQAQTNKIGTNAADSPNAITAQAGVATTVSQTTAGQQATNVQTAMTAQGYTPVRAGYLDTLSGLVASIWSYTTRILTAGTNIVLAKGTGLTGLNDIPAGTQMDLVNAPNATALIAIDDQLSNTHGDGAWGGGSVGLTGTAAAGSSTTLTLDGTASATDGIYVGQDIIINPGAAGQQVKTITAYAGRVATVDSAFTTAPTTGTVYLLPGVNGLIGGTVDANIKSVNGTPFSGANVPANTVQFGGHAVQLDSNNLPKVDAAVVSGGLIYPLGATVNSTYVVRGNIEIFQNSAMPFQYTLTDQLGNPVNLGGKVVRFIVWTTGGDGVKTTLFTYDNSIIGGVVVSGAGNNIVTVTFRSADTATIPTAPALLNLWNVTDLLPLIAGSYVVKDAQLV